MCSAYVLAHIFISNRNQVSDLIFDSTYICTIKSPNQDVSLLWDNRHHGIAGLNKKRHISDRPYNGLWHLRTYLKTKKKIAPTALQLLLGIYFYQFDISIRCVKE